MVRVKPREWITSARAWTVAAACSLIGLVWLTAWLLSKGSDGAGIANVLALPVAVIACFAAVYALRSRRTDPSPPPSQPPNDAALTAQKDRRVRPPAQPPRVPRRVVAFHMAGVVVAAGCFIAANFLPIGSGYWTDTSSGVQTAQGAVTLKLFHPLTKAIAHRA